ncbi:arsenate reductase ArsC [bacterium]|nr:arsenate reductase ArsC [bacterium]
MKKVAFICYANACRSQIAEGLSKVIGKGLFEAYSAGLHPLGKVCDEVREIMDARGIDITDQYSKGIDKIPLDEMDYIITMGCCSADSVCPVTYSGKRIEWNIPDPYGQDEYAFDKVVRIIEDKLRAFVNENFDDLAKSPDKAFPANNNLN